MTQKDMSEIFEKLEDRAKEMPQIAARERILKQYERVRKEHEEKRIAEEEKRRRAQEADEKRMAREALRLRRMSPLRALQERKRENDRKLRSPV